MKRHDFFKRFGKLLEVKDKDILEDEQLYGQIGTWSGTGYISRWDKKPDENDIYMVVSECDKF